MTQKELRHTVTEIEKVAKGFGLNPFEVVFECCNYLKLNEVTAAGGFPKRYPHWRFGMEYDLLCKQHTFGLQKIYEVVINNDPCYAYLLDTNSDCMQQTVISHVFGHADFFKKNRFFSQSRRNMRKHMRENAEAIERLYEEKGREEVEDFLDISLSFENLIDYQGEGRSLAEKGTRDLMRYLIEKGEHLEDWKREILRIVREEALYFSPQLQTKILNEGWASFWHSKIMNEKVLCSSDALEYASSFADMTAHIPGQMNPYRLGLLLLRYIEKKRGLNELFRVRETYNDCMLVQDFFDEDFCKKEFFFVYEFNYRSHQYEIMDRNFAAVKEALQNQLANAGQPKITLEDENYKGKGALLLNHHHWGADIKVNEALTTLGNLALVWGKPAYLKTKIANEQRILSSEEETREI